MYNLLTIIVPIRFHWVFCHLFPKFLFDSRYSIFKTMPRSKRDKQVSLTKTKKKTGRSRRESIVDTVRQHVDDHEFAFVFSVENLRSQKLSEVRHKFREDSRFCFYKRTVMAKALGRKPEEAYATNSHKLSKFLIGSNGIMFTNRPAKEVIRFFSRYSEPEFARSGDEATSTVVLDAGPLDQFPFSMEPQLRKLGLPTKLDKGVIHLTHDFTVCSKGDKLTPEKAKVLKLLGMHMTTFRLGLVCYWNKSQGVLKRMKKKEAKTDDIADD